MSTTTETVQKADAKEVRALLSELSQRLLAWSWEGVVGYEEIIERVGRAYGYDETTVAMEAQMAVIKLESEGDSTFVKVGIPGFPPLAYTQDVKDLLADIFAGKLSVAEARRAVKGLQGKEPPRSPFLVWIGVVIISMGFAVEVTGTWEGLLWAAITGMATGLAFLAADHVPGFGKIAQLVATLAAGIIVMLAYKFGWTAAAPGLLLVSSTFVFLPGDSISTQAYELAQGKWSAGTDRLMYSIMTLALMATGAFLAVVITGSAVSELFPSASSETFAWWAVYPGRAVLTLGILLAFHMSWKQFTPVLVSIWVVTVAAQLTSMAYGEYAGTFFGAIVGTLLALWLARKPYSISAFVVMVPIIFALSPGSHGLRQLETWVAGNTITGVDDLQTVFFVVLAIALGMVVGGVIAPRSWRWITRPVEA
jgi:uncharacterized membrane protein YjjP (DUF1212 family)